MDIAIRPAELTDVPGLCGLVEQYWRFEKIPDFERERIERLLLGFLTSPRHGIALVAARDSILVGYILLAHVFSLENGGPTAEIDEFFVVPAARGHGVGAQLLQEAESVLRRTGCTGIALQLGTGNEAGRAFYARQGYVPRSGYRLFEKRL